MNDDDGEEEEEEEDGRNNHYHPFSFVLFLLPCILLTAYYHSNDTARHFTLREAFLLSPKKVA